MPEFTETMVTPLRRTVALVTGSTLGIGLAIARRLGKEGAFIAIVGSCNAAKAEAAVQQIAVAGSKAAPHIADVRDAEQVISLTEQVIRDRGAIDILINAARVWYPTSIERKKLLIRHS